MKKLIVIIYGPILLILTGATLFFLRTRLGTDLSPVMYAESSTASAGCSRLFAETNL